MSPRAITIIVAISAAILILAVWLRGRWGHRARKQPTSGGFAWALLFLSSGRMPPPPPQSQIEEEAGQKKNRVVGRGDDT
jgi:hypothetical protein